MMERKKVSNDSNDEAKFSTESKLAGRPWSIIDQTEENHQDFDDKKKARYTT